MDRKKERHGDCFEFDLLASYSGSSLSRCLEAVGLMLYRRSLTSYAPQVREAGSDMVSDDFDCCGTRRFDHIRFTLQLNGGHDQAARLSS